MYEARKISIDEHHEKKHQQLNNLAIFSRTLIIFTVSNVYIVTLLVNIFYDLRWPVSFVLGSWSGVVSSSSGTDVVNGWSGAVGGCSGAVVSCGGWSLWSICCCLSCIPSMSFCISASSTCITSSLVAWPSEHWEDATASSSSNHPVVMVICDTDTLLHIT